MRLCVISHSYVEGGYLPVLETLASQPDVELALITPEVYHVGLHAASGRFEAQGVSFKVYALPIRFGGRQGTFLYASRALGEALDEFKPDVLLHEQEVFALGAAQIALAAKRRSIPLVMFVWENVYRRLSLPRRWLRSYVVKRCAGLMAGSTQAEAVHRSWGFAGPIAVIPQMGAALNPNPRMGRRGGGGLRVCFAGRLIASKGVDCLIRAVSALNRSGVVASCAIAGKGPEVDGLRTLAEELGVAGQVDFKGTISMPDVAEMLQASDVLVLPSRRTATWEEQYGRILIEAMAQATIAVGSRTGAIPEVIGADELLFAEDDVQGLTAVLERLATDDAFFVLQQERGWMRARDEYTTEVLSARKVAFLRRLSPRS